MEERITLDQVEAAIEGILEKYRTEFYPFEVGRKWRWLAVSYQKSISPNHWAAQW